jgi:hypothetical protein
MGDSEKRLAMNEALFRELNDRAEERDRLLSGLESELRVVCECDNLDCTERIPLSREEYREVRSDPRQCVVAPGHQTEGIEEIVKRSDHFEIVRKRGVAGEIIGDLETDEDILPPP